MFNFSLVLSCKQSPDTTSKCSITLICLNRNCQYTNVLLVILSVLVMRVVFLGNMETWKHSLTLSLTQTIFCLKDFADDYPITLLKRFTRTRPCDVSADQRSVGHTQEYIAVQL